MIKVRSFIFYLGMFLFTIPFTLISLFTFPLAQKYRYRFISLWAKTMIPWLKFTCNLSFEIHGSENIPNKPCIVFCNHQSAWETLALQIALPQQVWVLKRELLMIPFFGWGLWLTSPIAIDREMDASGSISSTATADFDGASNYSSTGSATFDADLLASVSTSLSGAGTFTNDGYDFVHGGQFTAEPQEEYIRITEAGDTRITEAGDVRIVADVLPNVATASLSATYTYIAFSSTAYVKWNGEWTTFTPKVKQDGTWDDPLAIYKKIDANNWKRAY
jgi:hypothetical protein